MIESERSDQARTRLVAHGIRWDPDTGEVTCPAGMHADQATAIWDQVRTDMDTLVLDLIDDVRQGKPAAHNAERTDGHTWVRPLQPQAQHGPALQSAGPSIRRYG
ncbi:hypothetical protein [Streptomyces graminilatus]|uniref:hypothetical protein n=1 Tax=Streptomyces graminilatus TaxID=1464070 RepID=UPI0006E1F27B|nr:hypothetical protein [Streptomyces graminilatus]